MCLSKLEGFGGPNKHSFDKFELNLVSVRTENINSLVVLAKEISWWRFSKSIHKYSIFSSFFFSKLRE